MLVVCLEQMNKWTNFFSTILYCIILCYTANQHITNNFIGMIYIYCVLMVYSIQCSVQTLIMLTLHTSVSWLFTRSQCFAHSLFCILYFIEHWEFSFIFYSQLAPFQIVFTKPARLVQGWTNERLMSEEMNMTYEHQFQRESWSWSDLTWSIHHGRGW